VGGENYLIVEKRKSSILSHYKSLGEISPGDTSLQEDYENYEILEGY
jgi:hypothetical protein